jgi:hypothetical protein
MIKAEIVKHSKSPSGVDIITWLLEYPRFIHSEFMTHRVFSRNSASSRAIPIERMIQIIEENPATPIHWGKNQAGMQAKEELQCGELIAAQEEWYAAMISAVQHSKNLHALGAHKQIANRVTEPYQHMKVVMTTTEHENWFWLRDHPDAQPEIGGVPGGLAKVMKEAYKNSFATYLSPGMWHLPFVNTKIISLDNWNLTQQYFDEFGNEITLEEAKMISASCCAQVSFRRQDGSLEKAEVIYKRLIESEPCHASPVEHQALSFDDLDYDITYSPHTWPNGVTHMDKTGNLWSGNFRGWIQHRQLIPNNARYG